MNITTWIDSIGTWDDLDSAPHRFGGVEFKVGNVEIGHVHTFNGMVDIPFTRKIREALVSHQLAEPHHLLPDSGWISFYIRNEADADHARKLMRLSYLHKRSRRGVVDVRAELATLQLGEAVARAAFPALYGSVTHD
jgi:hypothetical protein